ncbi:MAG: hypothetical protein ACRDND_11945 [Streptosporangiaceae bacterium]
MASNPQFYDATAEAAVNGETALANGGFLEIYTGTQPALNAALTGTKLAKLPLSATAFAAATASAGTASAAADAITSENALATGTAGYFAVLESDDSTVVATGSVGTASADLILSTLSLTSGASVSVSALTLSLPQT